MGPREWSRRWDAGHPGAFVRYAGAAEAVGEVICGKHCGVTDDKAPTKAAEKSDYELQRDARIARNRERMRHLGIDTLSVRVGACGDGKKPASARASIRCVEAVATNSSAVSLVNISSGGP